MLAEAARLIDKKLWRNDPLLKKIAAEERAEELRRKQMRRE